MKLDKALAAAVGTVAVLSVTACPWFSVPPVTIPLPEQTKTLADIWPDSKTAKYEGQTEAIPASDYLQIPPGNAGIPFDVPKEAKEKTDKIEAATLDVDFLNEIPAPIEVLVYLAKEKPFSVAPIGTIKVEAGGTTAKASAGSATVTSTLLREDKLEAGFKIKSLGTGTEKVKISSAAKITLKPKIVVKLKLW